MSYFFIEYRRSVFAPLTLGIFVVDQLVKVDMECLFIINLAVIALAKLALNGLNASKP